ncbi:ABC transporter permease [Catellatospora chokoriensis]|uniref:Transporter n=1 Tax=Catellatospora chokoriensis TaxID=310353 RepID=A0A8J3K9L8_9ACTN|nr:ABC transporter permease [Catellatospora chokoriensis]GIF92673.1 transporter [Catellatospora chokoriensis]
MALTFAHLKLRVLRNGFRGRPGKVILFVIGLLSALFYGVLAALFLLIPFLPNAPAWGAVIPAFSGTVLVLGWILMPLVWFGVDETLEPGRFALLPLPRPTLLRGLLIAALLGVPAFGTLLATTGLAIGAGMAGGPLPALVAAVGLLLGLLLCVVVSRAVTSGFARALRARRTRDLAAVVLAVLAASLGPIQFLLTSGAQQVGTERLTAFADVLGWTPLAAPYVVGLDAVHGDWAAVAGRLAVTVGTVLLLLWWWSSSLESAMVGTSGGGEVRVRAATGAPVARFFGRARLPRTPYGAMVQRELRYWVRDVRRRASLITFAVIGVFLPVVTNLGPGADGNVVAQGVHGGSMVLVGALAGLGIANQFGYDGTAYAMHVVVGVPGRVELRARAVAYSWYIVPLLLALAVLNAVLRGDLLLLPAMVGTLFAAYGTGLACATHASVWAAYALPENQNPFAINTGTGVAKSLLAMAAWFAGMVLAVPVLLLVLLGGSVGAALALPVGLAYAAGAIWLGVLTAGDILDHRQPELLAAITPRT